MTRDPRSRLDDPTAEGTTDQSTETASGLTTGEGERPADKGPGVERNKMLDEHAVRRTPQGRDTTPRRYEQPADDDPVMPTDDPSLGTKI
jgi:hypothetical protein